MDPALSGLPAGTPPDLVTDLPPVSEHAIRQEATPGPEPAPEPPKRGRPKGRKSASTLPPKVAEAPEGTADYKAVGASFALLVVSVSVMVGGKDFQAEPEELDTMAEAWGRYAEAHDLRDLPPGVAVVVATGTYYAKRLALPTEAPRIGRLREYLVSRYVAWKLRRAAIRKPA